MKLKKNDVRQICWKILFLALFAAFSVSAVKPVHAADIKLGVLDEGKLSDEYTSFQEAMQAIDQRAQNLDEQLKARDLLDAKEGERFDTLIIKLELSEDEQKELDGLLKSGNDRRNDLQSLSGKASRTDEDNARVEELRNILRTNTDAAQKLQDELLKGLLDQKHKTEEEYIKRANDTVAEIAKQKKLDLVLSKGAVVWNAPSVDITEDVLKKLNKK